MQRKRKKKRTIIILLLLFALMGLASLRYFHSREVLRQNDASSYEFSTNEEDKHIGPYTIEKKKISAEDVLAQMTLDEKIYQLLFVTPESLTNVGTVIRAGDTTKDALEKYPVGGIIYFSANIENREQLSNMIKNTQQYSKIPLFIGVDEEGGELQE